MERLARELTIVIWIALVGALAAGWIGGRVGWLLTGCSVLVAMTLMAVVNRINDHADQAAADHERLP